jgi:hypothetical protein
MDDRHPLEDRLRRLTRPVDPRRQAADLVAMADVRPARTGLLASKARLALAFLAGLLIGSTGLAAADALPDPAQHVAHQALTSVGVDVPDPERYHGPECGDEVQKNHGGYVREDHALAGTDCGKPVHSDADEADDDADDGAATPGEGKGPTAKGPCQGKPPWAGNKTMAPEEKAAAQADRAAQCGTEVDEADDESDDEADEADTQRAPEGEESTTTTEAPTTTTEAPTTTVAETSTTIAG